MLIGSTKVNDLINPGNFRFMKNEIDPRSILNASSGRDPIEMISLRCQGLTAIVSIIFLDFSDSVSDQRMIALDMIPWPRMNITIDF
jgi:hypothetical protein